MSYSTATSPPGLTGRTWQGLFALLAFCALMWSQTASANTTADATILNVVTVDYQDASGTTSYQATASSTVTVNLVEVAVTISGRPTGGSPGDTAAQPAELTGGSAIPSGTTGTYLYAVTAQANGDDIYDLTGTAIDAFSDVINQTVTFETVDPDGSSNPVAVTGASSITLGAGVIIGVPAVNQVTFPGGTMDQIAVNDIVVVNGVDYLVTATDQASSNGASHDNPGGVAHTDVGVTTAETIVTVTLAANTDGSNTAPAFTVGTGAAGAGDAQIGSVMGEQQLILVSVFADANNPPTNGLVDFDLVVTPDGAALPASVLDHTTEFVVVGLSIQKDVRNVTAAGAFAATATGDPGDVLEYRVTISNLGSPATQVIVTDPVPTYTQLLTFVAADYGGAGAIDGTGTRVFAEVSNSAGAPNVDELTVQATDDEDTTNASGNAAGTAAGSMLTFYIGNGNADTTDDGGTVTSSADDTFTILYQVQID